MNSTRNQFLQSAPHPAGPAIPPSDLDLGEERFVEAFAHLGRVGAGSELLSSIHDAVENDVASTGVGASMLGRPWRATRVVLAAAAAVLIALGAFAFQDAAIDAAIPGSEDGASDGRPSAPRVAHMGSVAAQERSAQGSLARGHQAGMQQIGKQGALVLEDPSLTFYHQLETFEGVNVEPGDLLALGDD